MAGQKENTNETTFDIKVKLTMLDYFRYYFSLFNLKLSMKIINVLSTIIILVYSMSLIFTIYTASTTGTFDLKTWKSIVLGLIIIILFTTPFVRTYLIAFKDAKTHNFLDKYVDIRISGSKFTVLNGDMQKEYSWKKMYKIFEFSHGFVLFIDKVDLAFVLPKRYFKNKEQIKFIQDIIAKYKK